MHVVTKSNIINIAKDPKRLGIFPKQDKAGSVLDVNQAECDWKPMKQKYCQSCHTQITSFVFHAMFVTSSSKNGNKIF